MIDKIIQVVLKIVQTLNKAKHAKSIVTNKVLRGLEKLFKLGGKKNIFNSLLKLNNIDKQVKKLTTLSKKNPMVKSLLYRYEKQKRMEWMKVMSEYRKIFTKVEQEMIRMFKTNKGFSEMDFREFRNWFLKHNYKEKSMLQDLFKDEIEIEFDSTWIYFGVFIHYGRTQKSGILLLQLYKGSQRNPSGLYQWVRFPKVIWDLLTKTPNGKTFWDIWYKRNRMNMKYLTYQSKYYIINKKKQSKNSNKE